MLAVNVPALLSTRQPATSFAIALTRAPVTSAPPLARKVAVWACSIASVSSFSEP